MNCPECGNPVENADKFCPKCYARIEPPGLWRRFLSLFQPSGKSTAHVFDIKRSVTIKTVGKDGERHEYHSLAEVPPELRSEIETLEVDASKEQADALTAQITDGTRLNFISKKSVTVFKIKDASGKERVYHSLEELPPEIRAAVEKAQRKLD
jgi:hypothetical protein